MVLFCIFIFILKSINILLYFKLFIFFKSIFKVYCKRMDNNIILFNKDGFLFKKMDSHCYKVEFTMENKNILLANIINFNLIKLIYDLNPDIYEKVNLEKLSDNEVNITLLMKHFFEDLGLPQRYIYINMQKFIQDNIIWFESTSITKCRPENICSDASLMPIKHMSSVCKIITPHNIDFTFTIYFEENLDIPAFAEKMVGIILHKIFKRVKQFIENLRI